MSQPATRPATAPEVFAEFDDCAGAQALVDRLSHQGFPVQQVRIVGTSVRGLAAQSCAVHVDGDRAADARAILGRG